MKVVTLDSIVAVIRARRGYKGFLYKFIEECEIVDAIPVSENATNGDVIMALFPYVQIEIIDNTVYTNIDNGAWFSLAWWNAPYKKEVEE